MLEKLDVNNWLELNAKLQSKKNDLRKALKEKGILKKEGNKYKVHFYASSEPSIFSNMKLNKYKNIGERFSKEIDNIIENSVKYFNKENIITSISSIFTLEDSYFTSLLTCNNIPFFYISKRTLMPDNHTIMPFYDEDTDKKIERMIVTEKQKLLTKIMIPNNY